MFAPPIRAAARSLDTQSREKMPLKNKKRGKGNKLQEPRDSRDGKRLLL